MSLLESFMEWRYRSKFVFSILVAIGVIIFWKGIWGLADIIFDEWLFGGKHYFWSNFTAAAVGLGILIVLGVALKRLTATGE
jgi:hypothetical protein